eukprot:4130599-Amphidinium_carterae.1
MQRVVCAHHIAQLLFADLYDFGHGGSIALTDMRPLHPQCRLCEVVSPGNINDCLTFYSCSVWVLLVHQLAMRKKHHTRCSRVGQEERVSFIPHTEVHGLAAHGHGSVRIDHKDKPQEPVAQDMRQDHLKVQLSSQCVGQES